MIQPDLSNDRVRSKCTTALGRRLRRAKPFSCSPASGRDAKPAAATRALRGAQDRPLGASLMSEQDDEKKLGKRSYAKIPEELELRMLRALALNIREYGNARYDLVREHPDFAPWIGAGAGATGKKRFRRQVDRVAKPMPPDRTKPHRGRIVNREQEAWAEDLWPHSDPAAGLPPVRDLMAGGLPLFLDLVELSRSLQTAKEDIERVRQAALVDDPLAPGGRAAAVPTLLLRAITATFDSAERHLHLFDRVSALMSNNGFTLELFGLVDELNADDPQKRALMREGIHRLVRKYGAAVALGAR